MNAEHLPLPRILIADDHAIVRQGLRHLLESSSLYTVCGEAKDGREAVTLAEQLHPAVAIVDISMPGLNGLEATRQLRKQTPKTKVILLTVHQVESLMHEAFRAGAVGYCLKSECHTQLLTALKMVCEGKHFFGLKVGEVVFDHYLQQLTPSPDLPIPPPSRLTSREREILQLLAEGYSNKEVACTLGISVKTVETHRAAIMQKLALKSVSELVRYAIRNHFIEA